jgi:hypothetical protein
MQDVIVIEAGRRERNYWLDLWRYRELFRVLAWRDLGSHPALSHHVGLDHHLRPYRAPAV